MEGKAEVQGKGEELRRQVERVGQSKWRQIQAAGTGGRGSVDTSTREMDNLRRGETQEPVEKYKQTKVKIICSEIKTLPFRMRGCPAVCLAQTSRNHNKPAQPACSQLSQQLWRRF